MLVLEPTVGCAVTSNILLGFVWRHIFWKRLCVLRHWELSWEITTATKKGRPEVKTSLNQVLTAELISRCDSIELVWSSLGPQKKKKKKMGGLFLPLRSLVRSRLSWRHEALRNLFVPWSLSYCFNTFSIRDSLPPGDLSKTVVECLNNMFMHQSINKEHNTLN